MKCAVLGFVLALSLATGGSAFAEDNAAPAMPDVQGTPDYTRVQLTIRDWFTNLSADTSVVENFKGDKLNLNDELGVEDGNFPEIKLRVNLNEKHSLQLSYLNLDWDGDKVVLKGLWLNDRPNGIFNRIETSAEIDYYRLGWRWNVVGAEGETGLKLQTILDAAVFKLDSNYKAYHVLWPFWPKDRESADGTGGLPILGLNATFVPAEKVELYGELSGMYAGKHGNLVDAELGARFVPFRNVFLETGYRYLRVKGEYDDEDASVGVSGPFIGAGVRF